MKKIKLTKIPSVFKNVPLDKEVFISNKILPEEGAALVVKILDSAGKKDDLDYATGRLGKLVKGDIIPAVLGYRKASVEFAGYIPKKISVGENLDFLCESGVIGKISGIYPSWGKPLKVKVLGAIIDKQGNFIKLKDYALKKLPPLQKQIPIIALIATRMDSGKTTMACKVIHYFTQLGKKVAALKVTGVAFSQDLYKFKENGADPVLDFVDMGLPSTCNGNSAEITSACLNLINHAKTTNPDYIIIEFGDSLIGEYHVADILNNNLISKQISVLILAAYDFAGVYGSNAILKDLGLKIDLVTGPTANSQVGVDLIKKYFNLAAESNQNKISKIIDIIKNKIRRVSYESKK